MPHRSPDKGAIWVKKVGMIAHIPSTSIHIGWSWVNAGISPYGSVVAVIDMNISTVVNINIYVFLAIVNIYFIAGADIVGLVS
jgi:hypothetical protein